MPTGPARLQARRLVMMAALLTLAGTAACEPPTEESESTVRLTLRIRLRAETQNIGPTAASVWIFAAEGIVPRGLSHPSFGIRCALSETPVTTCVEDVPRGQVITLLATEGDPAILANFGPVEDADTAHSGQYLEFDVFTGCEDEPEVGSCVVDSSGDVEVGAVFQYMTQVVVQQIGAARFDYLTFHPSPMLKVPAESHNILNSAGCSGVASEPARHCDSVRMVGSEPYRRIRAYVPRSTTFELRPGDGAQTSFIEWDYPCGVVIEGSGCVLRTSATDTAGTPLRVTFKYEYWQCPSGPSDRDTGGCTLIRP